MFLRALFDEMDKMKKPPKCPESLGSGEAEEGYEILGVLPADLQNLYILKQRVAEKFEDLVREHIKNVGQALSRGAMPDLTKVNSDHLYAAQAEVDLITSVFWREIRFAFPQTITNGKVELFQGWRVGWCRDTEPKLLNLLRSLMGSE